MTIVIDRTDRLERRFGLAIGHRRNRLVTRENDRVLHAAGPSRGHLGLRPLAEERRRRQASGFRGPAQRMRHRRPRASMGCDDGAEAQDEITAEHGVVTAAFAERARPRRAVSPSRRIADPPRADAARASRQRAEDRRGNVGADTRRRVRTMFAPVGSVNRTLRADGGTRTPDICSWKRSDIEFPKIMRGRFQRSGSDRRSGHRRRSKPCS